MSTVSLATIMVEQRQPVFLSRSSTIKLSSDDGVKIPDRTDATKTIQLVFKVCSNSIDQPNGFNGQLVEFELSQRFADSVPFYLTLQGHPAIYLLFPLAASILFTIGSLFLKRANLAGINCWTTIFFANTTAAVLFTGFWPMGGQIPAWTLLWQPATVAAFFFAGQCFIFSAFSYGDVSVAVPVVSTKVIFVTAMLAILTTTPPSAAIWLAAALATSGVVLINFIVPKSERPVVMKTILLASVAAFCFAAFDLCVQQFGRVWGTGRIGPISYWFLGLYSLALLPLANRRAEITSAGVWRELFVGGFLVASQACFLVYALSNYNDAAGINVVYSLRGLWGVLFAWLAANWVGGGEAKQSRSVMSFRLIGAFLLLSAVVIAILDRTNSS